MDEDKYYLCHSGVNGCFVEGKSDIKKMVVIYFEEAYKRRNIDCVEDQIWGRDPYPTMFNEASNEEFYNAINQEDILPILKTFTRDKRLGPDAWTVELFLQFYDTMGLELLSMVEESRVAGHITPEINSTYIARIPKMEDMKTF